MVPPEGTMSPVNDEAHQNDPVGVEEAPPLDSAPERKGVFGWVKGKIQKRQIAVNMNNINLDNVEKNALEATATTEPSELDIAMGLGTSGVVEPGEDDVADEEKIDLEAENDEGLLVGWGKKLQEVEIVKKTVEVVQKEVANQREQQELREYYEKYKDEIKQDSEIKAIEKKIRKIKKNLKVQRLNGDRTQKRNSFAREKEQKELDKKTARLKKAIWTFSNSSMNSHEYAKAMMRASARLQRKGVNVHKSEKALAMEAAVLRNMHRMLAIQKQYTMAKKSCSEVSSFVKRCKGWLDNKLADGEMCIMVLEATSKSMGIMYQEVIDSQEAILPKFQDPENHTFKKERMKTILALPKGLRSMPTFLKGPSRPPMKISLRKKVGDEDPNLRGYKSFKEQSKAMEKAWKEELHQYENLLEVGGEGFKEISPDDVSEIGDSEDEIEEHLAEVKIVAAAAKKAAEPKGEGKKESEETRTESEEKDLGAVEDDDVDANTGGESLPKAIESLTKASDETEAEEDVAIPTEKENVEAADAAALEAQKAAGATEKDPEVDEGALPEDVKQEDLDFLLNKEAEEVNPQIEDNDDAVEEGLHRVVEDALAGVEDEGSDDDGEEA